MSANEVLQELSKVGRANMLDYMRVGPDGDPVLDFSQPYVRPGGVAG
jgi:phage terminase small subunit